MGTPDGVADAVSYQARKPALQAGTNLRGGDFVNMGLARAASLPVVGGR